VLFVYVCVKYLVFQAAPPLPPSPEEALRMHAESGKEGFFLGLRNLMKNRGFILLLITYGLAVSVINSLCTLLNELILAYFPVCMCVIRNLYYWCLNWIAASKTLATLCASDISIIFKLLTLTKPIWYISKKHTIRLIKTEYSKLFWVLSSVIQVYAYYTSTSLRLLVEQLKKFSTLYGKWRSITMF